MRYIQKENTTVVIPLNPRFKDLTGNRYGMLTVAGYHGETVYRGGVARHWLCACDCGKQKVINACLLRGGVKSCGCKFHENRREARKTHGMTDSPEWRTWKSMIERCFNKHAKGYERYGGIGITVHPEWVGVNGFASFLNFVGKRPSGCSIGRINNDGNYEPGNVSWETPVQQASNKSNNHILTIDGKSLNITQWSTVSGVSRILICNRKRAGWNDFDAVFTVPDQRKSRVYAKRRNKGYTNTRGDIQVLCPLIHGAKNHIPCGPSRGFFPREMFMQTL